MRDLKYVEHKRPSSKSNKLTKGAGDRKGRL
jgi:hypothetical protein